MEHAFPANLTALRKQLYMNQKEFWGAIGVTQSAGSRYESGKNIPAPVQELLRLVYIDQLNLSKVSRPDMDIAIFLKTLYPELYENLRKSMLMTYKNTQKGQRLSDEQTKSSATTLSTSSTLTYNE